MSFLRTEYHFVEDSTVRSTTSDTAFLSAVTLTTPSLPLGTYRLEFTAEWSVTAWNKLVDFQVTMDGVVIEDAQEAVGMPPTGFVEFGSYVTLKDIQGPKTFVLGFKGGARSTEVIVRNATIEIFRVK